MDGLVVHRRSPGCLPTVGPLPPDGLTVPPKQRLGRDDESSPPVPRQGPARGSKQDPVAVFEFRPSDRAAEHLHLVTKDGVLELELRDGPRTVERDARGWK
jgi:hypothetical protein